MVSQLIRALPLEPTEVAASMAQFGQSKLLPRAAYTDERVLAWERENFFGDWVCIGRSADLAEPGTQRAVTLGTSGVLVTRGRDAVLRGFVNACRHRGHELLPCGSTVVKRSVVCPYHAWAYDLGGSLRNAPGFQDAEHFDTSTYGLQELPTTEWHGWMFIAPSGNASDFAEHVGKLESILSNYQGDKLQVVDSHDYIIEANWKVIVENYQECYHCSMIHPELCAVSPPKSGENIDGDGGWVGGYMDLRPEAATMSLDGSSQSVVIDTLNDLEQRTVMYIALFPNLLISLHPDYVMTHVLTPLAAAKTHVECTWLFPPEAVGAPGFDPSGSVDFWDITNKQDWAACESVQRGLSAQQYIPGPLAPDEDGVYDFVSLVAGKYAQGLSG